MPKHKHDVKDSGHSHQLSTVGPFEGKPDIDWSTETSLGSTVSTQTGSASINETEKGGDEPHNNLPPYYALAYIIKY